MGFYFEKLKIRIGETEEALFEEVVSAISCNTYSVFNLEKWTEDEDEYDAWCLEIDSDVKIFENAEDSDAVVALLKDYLVLLCRKLPEAPIELAYTASHSADDSTRCLLCNYADGVISGLELWGAPSAIICNECDEEFSYFDVGVYNGGTELTCYECDAEISVEEIIDGDGSFQEFEIVVE